VFKWRKIGLVHAYLFDRPLVSLVSAILLLTGLIFGVRYFLHARSHEVTDDAFIDAYMTEIAPKVSSNVVKVHVTPSRAYTLFTARIHCLRAVSFVYGGIVELIGIGPNLRLECLRAVSLV